MISTSTLAESILQFIGSTTGRVSGRATIVTMKRAGLIPESVKAEQFLAAVNTLHRAGAVIPVTFLREGIQMYVTRGGHAMFTQHTKASRWALVERFVPGNTTRYLREMGSVPMAGYIPTAAEFDAIYKMCGQDAARACDQVDTGALQANRNPFDKVSEQVLWLAWQAGFNAATPNAGTPESPLNVPPPSPQFVTGPQHDRVLWAEQHGITDADLLTEGFLDSLKNAGKAIAASPKNATAAAGTAVGKATLKGVAKVASPIVAPVGRVVKNTVANKGEIARQGGALAVRQFSVLNPMKSIGKLISSTGDWFWNEVADDIVSGRYTKEIRVAMKTLDDNNKMFVVHRDDVLGAAHIPTETTTVLMISGMVYASLERHRKDTTASVAASMAEKYNRMVEIELPKTIVALTPETIKTAGSKLVKQRGTAHLYTLNIPKYQSVCMFDTTDRAAAKRDIEIFTKHSSDLYDQKFGHQSVGNDIGVTTVDPQDFADKWNAKYQGSVVVQTNESVRFANGKALITEGHLALHINPSVITNPEDREAFMAEVKANMPKWAKDHVSVKPEKDVNAATVYFAGMNKVYPNLFTVTPMSVGRINVLIDTRAIPREEWHKVEAVLVKKQVEWRPMKVQMNYSPPCSGGTIFLEDMEASKAAAEKAAAEKAAADEADAVKKAEEMAAARASLPQNIAAIRKKVNALVPGAIVFTKHEGKGKRGKVVTGYTLLFDMGKIENSSHGSKIAAILDSPVGGVEDIRQKAAISGWSITVERTS